MKPSLLLAKERPSGVTIDLPLCRSAMPLNARVRVVADPMLRVTIPRHCPSTSLQMNRLLILLRVNLWAARHKSLCLLAWHLRNIELEAEAPPLLAFCIRRF